MGSLTVNCWCSRISNSCTSISTLAHRYSTFMGGNFIHLYDMHKALPAETSRGLRYDTRSFAKKSVKKSTKNGDVADKSPSEDYVQNDKMYPVLDSAAKNSIIIPSRSTVLQACTVTSGLIAALALVIRQVSHVAAVEGLPILDCSAELSFGFEVWHLELIIGLVVLISSCRFLLLKTWTDFAKSSQAANQQILTSLEPLDYMVVAFLPGISEELLFRGALLPLFGFNWKSISVVAIIFGVLHLGSGRKYSFAVWATFVGLVYGYATIASSNLIVPMVSHAVNNLVGGILWRYSSRLSD
ncbi:CAAX amino terminal protease [Quillaja saponaria]|uniref:CAAX amino terminal protease n=1 Tax=Quillaja saponaria TaxID=32244 RepID=A0AAD7PK28_QUISA|nr:CAAX amino terminal protease [Quillaja saponaria]